MVTTMTMTEGKRRRPVHRTWDGFTRVFKTTRSLTTTNLTSLQEEPCSIPQYDDKFNFRESQALSLHTSSTRRDQELHFLSLPVFSARCNIYISRLCHDASPSVRRSVTEVHWCIIANLGFKFRSHFTAPCGRRAACGRNHLAPC